MGSWEAQNSAALRGKEQQSHPNRLLLLVLSPCRCCLAVHHCGVGTCGAVLRAGIPSVPCPVMLDQPFLAERLVEAGVACTPLPFHKISTQVCGCRAVPCCVCCAVWRPQRASASHACNRACVVGAGVCWCVCRQTG